MGERADIAERLEVCFEEILVDRMADVPILNTALSVKVVGGRKWQNHWLDVLVTPWFMNLILVPERDGSETFVPGGKRHFLFPAGQFEFLTAFEEMIGPYWMCSLFSPMFEFADQETAEAAARAALDALFEADRHSEESEQAMARMWRGEIPETDAGKPAGEVEGGSVETPGPTAPREVSRRAFLTGKPREESS